MFTGLIERVGRLESLQQGHTGAVLSVSHDEEWDQPLAPGESVAVSGVCLTVARVAARQFACDLLAETLGKTNLGGKEPGDLLNLERALRAGDRLGGHMVSGHVDGTGRLLSCAADGCDRVLEFVCDRRLMRQVVLKGSIAVDGISLTVAAVGAEGFRVHIIPFTWDHTALSSLREGDSVNLETDMIGKYVARYLETRDEGGRLTMDDLRRAGFST